MNNSYLDTFFHYSSKIIIVIPIILVVLAVIIRGTQTEQNKINKKILPTPIKTLPTLTATPSALSKIKEATNAARLTLKDSFSCSFDDNNNQVKVSVNNKQAYISYKSNSNNQIGVLLKDCFYSWDNITYKGVKICNLAPIIMLMENTPISSLINNQFLLPIIKGKEELIVKLIDSCKKTSSIDQSIFFLPSGIRFEPK